MAFTARVYNVLIASPGDTTLFRDLVERTLYSWNRDRAEGAQAVLRPLRWEFDAVSAVGPDAQSVINQQLVEKADILVGLFHSRLGEATERSASGTAEEIDEAAKAGKKVHVYFSEMPLPRDFDRDQLAALDEFKVELGKRMLLGSFASPDDLAARVRTAVEADVAELAGTAVPGLVAGGGQAALHAVPLSEREPHMDSRGRTTMRSRGHRIEVTNTGVRKAERVRIELRSRDGRSEPRLMHREVEPDIAPNGGRFTYPYMGSMGSASAVDVVLTWNEGDEERNDTQTLSL